MTWYEGHLKKHVDPHLGSIQVARIQRHNIETLLGELKSKPTRNAVYDTLKVFFTFAEVRGLVREHPMKGLKKPRLKRAEKVRIWTAEEVAKLMKEAQSSPYYAVYALALGGGLRRGEIFALRWRDISIAKRTVRVERGLTEVKGKFAIEQPKTESSARTVMLPAATIEALKTMKRGEPDDLIFTDSAGGFVRRSNFDRRVHRPLIAQAGIPHRTVHEMRHTHASLLLAEV